MRSSRNWISTSFALCVTLVLSAACHKQLPNPKAVVLNNEAAQYVLHGESARALQLFEEAVKVDPSYYLAHANIMSVYLTEHNFTKALSQANELTTLQARNPFGWLYRGLIGMKLGNTEQGKSSFTTLEHIYEEYGPHVKPDRRTQFLLDYATVLKLLGETEKYKQMMKQAASSGTTGNSDTYYRLLQNSDENQLVQILLGSSYQVHSSATNIVSP